MKRIIPGLLLCAIACLLAACASAGPAAAPAPAAAPIAAEAVSPDASGFASLDAAIEEAAAYFAGELPAKAKVAITGIDAPASPLADYILEELWARFRKRINSP
jgi:hypothetical protein